MRSFRRSFIFAITAFALSHLCSAGQALPTATICDGPFKGSKKVRVSEVDELLAKHAIWLHEYAVDTYSEKALGDSRRAKLCGADLSGLDLSNRNFERADLSNANLRGTNFSNSRLVQADMSFSDLTNAILWSTEAKDVVFAGSILRGAGFINAKLPGATIFNADAQGANFTLAVLAGALLQSTNFTDANFDSANLKEAHVGGSDFSNTIYEVSADGHPHVQTLSSVKNLHLLRFTESPRALWELRDLLKKAGLIAAARDLTYAIRKGSRERAGHLEGGFEFVLFEATCQYCRTPWRPALLLIGLIPLFGIAYGVGLIHSENAGIWKIWAKDRIRSSEGQDTPERIRHEGLGSLLYALYFSVLSAFNIGWKELTIGSWLVRLQTKEYVLQGSGWIRSLAGIQALLSVYFLALWALCYFSQPFG